MNILHIAHIDNNLSNGVSVVVPKHIKYQSKLDNVALLNCYKGELNTDKTEGIKYFTLQECRAGDISVLEYPFNKPDLVIFHEIYRPYFVKVAKYLIMNDIKYIIVPHGGMTQFAQNKKYLKKTIANKTLFKNYINKSLMIQYLSEREKEDSKAFITKRNIISGNGIEINNRDKIYNINDDDIFNITFIGRLEIHHKGLDLLIEACNIIRDKLINNKININIYGPDEDGGKKILLDLIVKYKLSDVIHINGPVYKEDKQKVLDKTHIFILTSRFEGQPLAIMEAIANGIPVIATEGTNMVDKIREYKCGWSCKTTKQDIATAIETAYEEKNNIDIYSENCIKLAQNEFSWEKVSDDTINMYRNLK